MTEKMIEKMLAIRESLRDNFKLFRLITEREMCEKDKRFIGWFMKLDPRTSAFLRLVVGHSWSLFVCSRHGSWSSVKSMPKVEAR